ncbi:MAG: uridine kinase [Gemmatimonadaceae bacterium]|nr:uridine kinase [Gemmatimonadaceae bacterium]
MQPLLIGIAGGTGSGKSTVTRRLADALAGTSVGFIAMDAYYRDLGAMPMDERRRRNFDHPDAYDLPLLVEHLDLLHRGQSIEVPVYDFRRHERSTHTTPVPAGEVIIVDGILLFHDPRVRDLCDVKVFVDADADVRLARRIRRDMAERGRSLDDILDQYLTTVRPMHDQFIAPTKAFADLVIPHGGHNDVAVDLLLQYVTSRLRPVPT